MKNNHYVTLGISPEATEEEIKKAYREMSKKLHPDKNDGEDKGFAAVAKAYEVLSDPSRRERYDQTGADSDGNDEAQISSIISGLTMSFLSHVSDVKTKSLPEFIKSTLNKQMNELRKEMDRLKADIVRFCEVRDRISVNVENNLILQVINARIEESETNMSIRRNDVFIFQKAWETMEGYSYRIDEEKASSLYSPNAWHL